MQPSNLLLTKLNRPAVTADHIFRPRLIDILNRGLSGPLSVVSAAAGFGKTTLVSAWIEELNAQVGSQVCTAWLSLDEADSDLIVFLQYVVAAIRSVVPESCAETYVLLQASQPISPAELVAVLSNDLERLPLRCALVLDDYQAIQGTIVHDFVSRLTLHWPQHLHLTVISRVSPPLPIANLRAKGQVAEIRTRDLRFTTEESAEFLSKVLAAPLSQSIVDLLDQRIEGWIAGLRLVTLSLRPVPDPESELASLSGSSAEITDYLFDQVVLLQPPAIQEFLLTTSILDRFCAPLCEKIVGVAIGEDPPYDVAACIQWLKRASLFIIPMDNDQVWYRYHHLFQELLRRRLLAEVGSEQIAANHRAAIAWFASQGLIEEAIQHALAIADLDLTAQLMQMGLRDVLNREDRPTLDRWLSMLPDDFVRRRPWLLMIKALALQFSYQFSALVRVLRQIEALVEPGDDVTLHTGEVTDLRELRGLIALLRSQEKFFESQAPRTIACSEEALALLPENWRYARGGARMFWGISLRAIGQGEYVHRLLIDEYMSSPEKTDAYTLRILFIVSINALEMGNLERAKQAAQALLAQATLGQLAILQGWARYFLGVVHYQWNELDIAAQHFQQVANRRYAVHVYAARNSLLGLVRVYLAGAKVPEAWQTLNVLRELDLEYNGQERDDTRSVSAYVEYFFGNRGQALRWVDTFVAPVPDRLANWVQDPHLAKARILLAKGATHDIQTALDISNELYEIAQRNFSTSFQIEICALRAIAFDAQGNAAAANAALREAVELAQLGGYIRAFVELGLPMRTLLVRFSEIEGKPEAIHDILAAFVTSGGQGVVSHSAYSDRAANMELVEPLTGRELEVLALLPSRMSNKEIGRQLGITLATVKRHTISIYGKLDVNSRWDAVLKAEALGLLPKH